MNQNNIGILITQKRKSLGYTQQNLAEMLGISFQAVSKWENGTTMPDITLLPQIARILETSVDALLNYQSAPITDYDEKYKQSDYYWGIAPNHLCYEIMKLMPPVKAYRVLDIGCGEGKDAVFLAKNGYIVSAFDAADSGLNKARKLAEQRGVHVDFFKADVMDYQPHMTFDIILCSGVLHYIASEHRKNLIERLKAYTSANGIHAMNVFVEKPFIPPAPDMEERERMHAPWYSGELFTYYHDWLFHKNEEQIFDCNSGGISHQHCMNVLIAEKK